MQETVAGNGTAPYSELAPVFFRELFKIQSQTNGTVDPPQVGALLELLHQIFQAVTRKERIPFATQFARIAYVCHRYQIERYLQYYLHLFRKKAQYSLDRVTTTAPGDWQMLLQLGTKVTAAVLEALWDADAPDELRPFLKGSWPEEFKPAEVREFHQALRVVALSDDPENDQLVVELESAPGQLLRMQYNLPERNELFQPTIQLIRQVFEFPVTLYLLETEVDTAGVLRPRAIVVEPDYLVDVSAVAECFRGQQPEPWLHLLKKFTPFQTTRAIMVGNIANFFLDELMSRPEASFQELFPQVFRLNPLAFALFEDSDVKEIYQIAKGHYQNLKEAVLHDFPGQRIRMENAFLEPSFYSDIFGLQGRLDLFYQPGPGHAEGDLPAIVELKSGKIFQPNQYGICQNHFVQTLLYDLLLRSSFGFELENACFILYSGVEQGMTRLRFAPRIKSLQWEALQLRNQLLALEWSLAQQRDPVFSKLHPAYFPHWNGFNRSDLELFANTYQSLDPLEKRYFQHFASFIAREHQLAKIGIPGQARAKGLSALWLETAAEKQDNFNLLNHLSILENRAQTTSEMVLQRTDQTAALANFRKGDIIVLYPAGEPEQSTLRNQLFKGTIAALEGDTITLKLRSRPFNARLFSDHAYWNVEHDLLDSSFISMYKGLFDWASQSSERRSLMLGRIPPAMPATTSVETPAALTGEQADIFQKAVQAKDYFLLWGPPGTGKTNMMLKYLVSHLSLQAGQNLLVLAYTNRAVEEICEAIATLPEEARPDYLRFGSLHGSDERFRPYFLETKMAGIANRQQLRQLLDSHRVFIGTVASLVNRLELLQLKHFHCAIIDEASQVLEPLLIGLLPRFERFILVGDHKQLPAVVVQPEAHSAINDADLKDAGMVNCRNSLFERLFRQCLANNWHWAYAQLRHQGRMHRDIMAFPNQYFYESTLDILPEGIPDRLRQTINLPMDLPGFQASLDKRLLQQRLLFLPTPIDGPPLKTNRHEAWMVVQLVKSIQRIYAATGRQLQAGSLGIITPYRAQIAEIKATLQKQELYDEQLYTIDTVERYQGGARDIIILSLCTNSIVQLESLVSLSEEGVDRKLNVALTRAREQVIILGNEELLQSDPVYRSLLEHCDDGERKTVIGER